MSRSARLYNAALGGCLAVLLLAPSVASQAGQEHGDSHPSAEARQERTAGPDHGSPSPPTYPQASEFTRVQGNSDVEPEPEKNANYYARRDIVAQERMADATEALVNPTRAQALIGLIALGLLIATLIYTRSASKSAAAAADHTRDAVKAAEDAAEEARRQADAAVALIEKGERPRLYLTIDYFDVIGNSDRPQDVRVEFIVRNFGRHPAIVRRLQTDTQILPKNQRPDPRSPSFMFNMLTHNWHDAENVVIEPGQKWQIGHIRGQQMLAGEIDAIRNDARRLYFIAWIAYQGPWDRAWTQTYAFTYFPAVEWPGSFSLPPGAFQETEDGRAEQET